MGIRESEAKRRSNQAAEYANLARAEKGRSDLAKAQQFFRRALGFEETNLVALTGMAELMLAQKLYDQAGTFAVRALAVFEAVPEAYLVLGEVALAKNDPARARTAFERALSIRPDFWPAKARLRELSK
jgi:tetratricopeptide (TPR) repeat protein